MRVTVSSHGKFHAFQLGRQLARHGALERILTSDPRVFLEPGIPLLRARAFPLSEAVARLPRRVALIRDLLPWSTMKSRLYDRWASTALGRPDLVVAWSGAARHVIEAARRRGSLAILERGSTHIAYQDQVLRRESELRGVAGGVAPRDVREEEIEYALADRIMVPSKFARQTFLDRGFPADKILQVPYGSDVNAFSPGKKEDDVFRIVFAGALTYQKGVPYLLEAVRKLDIPRAELVLAGAIAPEMEPLLRQYEGHYRAVGSLNRRDLAELFRQASVFVLPSLQEGLAMVIREALASGVPVIATPNSGAEDAFRDGEAGFIVPSHDAEALATAIERLYRDPALRAEMARNAGENASAWTWDDYGDAVIAEYSRVLASRRPFA